MDARSSPYGGLEHIEVDISESEIMAGSGVLDLRIMEKAINRCIIEAITSIAHASDRRVECCTRQISIRVVIVQPMTPKVRRSITEARFTLFTLHQGSWA